jgi:hypothetical protein
LVLWLRADTIAGVADGGALTTWSDESGQGNDFTQATADKKPLYKAGIIGGQPVVRFDGSNDLLVCSSNFSTAQVGTVAFVYRLTAAVANYETLLSTTLDSGSTKWVIVRAYRHSSTPNACLSVFNGADSRLLGSTTIAAATNYALIIKTDGSTTSMRLNGANDPIVANYGANTGAWWGDVANRTLFALGAYKNDGESQFLKGDLAEVIVYDAALSAGDIAALEAYLSEKYSLGF